MGKSYDDYIFFGYNKKYGAYRLRKRYEKNLMVGFLSTNIVFFFSIIILYDYYGSITFSNASKPSVIMQNIEYPVLKKPIDKVLSEKSHIKKKSNTKLVPEEEKSEYIKNDNISDSIITDVDTIITTNELYDTIKDFDETNFLEDSISIKSLDDFKYYITKELVYPYQAKTSNTEGIVYIKFRLDPNGNTKDIEVVKGFGFGCEEEAIRLVKESPKWKISIDDYIIVPIKFKPSKN